MLATADFFEAVRRVELDCRQRGINVDAGSASGDGRGFGGPEQRRTYPLSRCASPHVKDNSQGWPEVLVWLQKYVEEAR